MNSLRSWLFEHREVQTYAFVGVAVTAASLEYLGLSRILAAIAGRLRIKLLGALALWNNKFDDATVSQIFIYPVKSLKAVSIENVRIDAKGLVGDRRYMLVAPRQPPMIGTFGPNDATHQFMTQRQVPLLATIRAIVSAKDGSLTLSSPLVQESVTIQPMKERVSGKKLRARIWDDITEVTDLGHQAGKFLSRVVSQDKDAPPLADKMRLVVMNKDDRFTDERYTPRSALSWTGAAPKVSLTDGFPVLIVSEASLDELNKRLGEKGKKPIPMSRFRPNIVVKGTKPFEEDTWRVISIDRLIFHIVKGCPRCKQSCTDQETGRVFEEPLETLSEFRALGGVKENVYFAQNAIAQGTGGSISVGSRICVLERGDPIWDVK